jgi:hypothetical protein
MLSRSNTPSTAPSRTISGCSQVGRSFLLRSAERGSPDPTLSLQHAKSGRDSLIPIGVVSSLAMQSAVVSCWGLERLNRRGDLCGQTGRID